jgi:hypothetical protein
MQYKDLFVKSYARSASNFIIYNTAQVAPSINIHKRSWRELDKNTNDSVTVSILRDPKDAIISDISMSVFDMQYNIDQIVKLDYQISIDSFKEYMVLLNKNINNIVPFTFEQITENPKETFKIFLQKCGHNQDFDFPNVKIKEKVLNNELMNKKQIFLPSSKNLETYTKISNYISSNNIFKSVVNDYNKCKLNIYKRQLDFL